VNRSKFWNRVKTHGMSVLIAGIIAVSTVLLPGSAPAALAQGVSPACKDDAGRAVMPNPGAGIGAWLLVLNFNHAPSATSTVGCLVMTTGLNPQQVSRTLVACPLVGNVGMVTVGNGVAPFDGNFSITCPGVLQGKQTLENFTIWGRANFAKAGATYTIAKHQDVEFSAGIGAAWHVMFSSRYGATTFASGDGVTNLNGQVVSFGSAVSRIGGGHSLNGSPLAPPVPVTPFEFNFDQPITIGAPGQLWTLAELIFDPPGGCCKS
jgi:hypothetical protein